MGLFDFIRNGLSTSSTGPRKRTACWSAAIRCRFRIQYGAQLTVRDSQLALFVDQGKVADNVCSRRPVHADHADAAAADQPEELGQSCSVAVQVGRVFLQHPAAAGSQMGHANPITIRDKDFGVVRLRAFGIYSYRISDPVKFYKGSLRHARNLYR